MGVLTFVWGIYCLRQGGVGIGQFFDKSGKRVLSGNLAL